MRCYSVLELAPGETPGTALLFREASRGSASGVTSPSNEYVVSSGSVATRRRAWPHRIWLRRSPAESNRYQQIVLHTPSIVPADVVPELEDDVPTPSAAS